MWQVYMTTEAGRLLELASCMLSGRPPGAPMSLHSVSSASLAKLSMPYSLHTRGFCKPGRTHVKCVSMASQKAMLSPLQLHGSRHAQSDLLCAGVKTLGL